MFILDTTKAEVSRNGMSNITADLGLWNHPNTETQMKIVKPVLPFFVLCAVTLTAQQTHRTTTAAHRRPAAPCPEASPLPTLPAGIPPATGKVESAFALRYIDIQPGNGAEA
jgi:hypothetical protein